MCIRTVTSDEDITDEVPYDVPHIFDNDMIPNHLKSKITKAMNKYTKRNGNAKNDKKINEENHVGAAADVLAQSTGQLKTFLHFTRKYWEIFQDTNIYKVIARILFRTSQPAHIIAIIAILYTASAVVPRSDIKTNNVNRPHSKLLSFIYLTSFILHLGSQFWMTFVSGLSLYFALPRNNFGQVQRILFPRYFTLNACFSLATLVIFLKYHPFHTWDIEIAIQVGAMFSVFFLELFIRLYLTPPLIGLMTVKATIEKAAGIGNEIAEHKLGPLENCPHYLKIHRAFRKIHMYIAMGNILTMVCTILHLNYIASKICF